ncbi:type II toxin-antitoxin system Phd/YefM family antitoxin [Cyanobium sp. WAJ14-Wanaka]|uniref:type II toxin-antitoxin system Phd/YefM family antitoxin n=1 Tax=Cyanobium sp. WAJ14-Wanaka TaxID=2823725 RepID=UPI0020CE26EA|nr:type II toxin-antitoxin system Phd/YefM family antitoxin [Cyanobium sp. WAJ14-Wanaka]
MNPTPQPQPKCQPSSAFEMADSVGVEAARRRLPELLDRAAGGERILIKRHHKPVAALVPLADQPPADPIRRQRQIQSLLGLQGSGRHCWNRDSPRPARPVPATPAYVQSVQRDQAFAPHLLRRGSKVALDGSALVAYICDAKGTGKYLGPLIEGIAQGYWLGVLSTVSLMRVLEGPLACGDEALVQRYSQAFADGRHWQLISPDAAMAAAAVRLRRQEPQLDEIGAIELATAIQSGAAVLVTDHPALAHTGQHPVLSALRI